MGEQLGAIGPSTMSLAEALYETAAPEEPVASAMMLAGRLRMGLVVSSISMVNWLLLLLPRVSLPST